MTLSDDTVSTAWRVFICSVVVLAGVGAGLGTVQAQDNTAYYYGDAVSEDSATLPTGTVIRAVTEENGSNETLDQITMDSAGEYGGAGLGEEKLQVPATVDGPVYFVAENDLGTFTADETVQNPSSGTQQRDLTFPPGAAESRPYFDVSGLQPTDETVIEGDTVDVSATVENRGSEQGSQTVSLAIDGQSTESTEVTLGPGSQETVSFAIDTATLGAGNYTYTVASGDTSQFGDLTVEASLATFTVDRFSPSEQTVVEGNAINASATVTNDGNAKGTQTVTLEAGGTTLASSDVALAAGDERTVSFSDVNTDALAPGRYTYGVYTNNGSQTGTLTVESRRATFIISGLNPTGGTLTVGDEFSTSATVSNNGNAEGTQTISFQVGDTQYGSESVTLTPDEEQTLSFGPVDTTDVGPGSYSFEVGSANDSQTGTLVVESDDPATFTVTDLRPTDTTVVAGQSFDIEAAIRNDGDRSATQQVRFRRDGNTVDRDGVTLEGGELATVSFTDIGTSSLEPGTYTYGAYTANDSHTGTLIVEASDSESGEETPSFTVSAVEPADTAVTAGTDIAVSATITNGGAVKGTQGIRLFVDAETVQSESVTLAPAAETTVSLTVDTASLSVGSHVYRVVTDDDQQAESFSVTADSQPTPPPRPTSVTATPPETRPTTTATPPGTLSETVPETPAETTQSTTTESEDGGGGGLLPSGLLGTVILWVGVPLLVIYGILKTMAIYLGY
jgi:hypothetical protein